MEPGTERPRKPAGNCDTRRKTITVERGRAGSRMGP
jgi:hypothetical protein